MTLTEVKQCLLNIESSLSDDAFDGFKTTESDGDKMTHMLIPDSDADDIDWKHNFAIIESNQSCLNNQKLYRKLVNTKVNFSLFFKFLNYFHDKIELLQTKYLLFWNSTHIFWTKLFLQFWYNNGVKRPS